MCPCFQLTYVHATDSIDCIEQRERESKREREREGKRQVVFLSLSLSDSVSVPLLLSTCCMLNVGLAPVGRIHPSAHTHFHSQHTYLLCSALLLPNEKAKGGLFPPQKGHCGGGPPRGPRRPGHEKPLPTFYALRISQGLLTLVYSIYCVCCVPMIHSIACMFCVCFCTNSCRERESSNW